ncbi:hypothetical protein [Streptomyces sp. NBC_00236]|uniref:hypothetical protein n=1 Tax=unclassified Streptomyces TaxID=2593676 RepID=UPI002E2E4741|nr:hypothetical protein [Streptomyces sp. NBC_00236]
MRDKINRVDVEKVRAIGASASVRSERLLPAVAPWLPPRRVCATVVTSIASLRRR